MFQLGGRPDAGQNLVADLDRVLRNVVALGVDGLTCVTVSPFIEVRLKSES